MKFKVILCLLTLLATSFFLYPEEKKTANIVFVEKRVKIDGNLDEEFYKTLTPMEDFSQFHPKNGEKATFKTQVYSFYDKKNIYFAFRCYDGDPKKIAADITPFDGYIDNDEITVYLDTYKDKMTYDYFSVNPRGIKSGKNTVWDASAKITDYGWLAEIRIPFKSLRFPVREIQQWAVNFKRFIFRLNETDYWTKMDRDQLKNSLADTFANLDGIKNIKGGKNIELFPYAGYRNSISNGEKDNKFAYGLDLKYGITSNLTLDLTSSPDYSEVESDPFFYQFSPYEYNLSENRPFYNEGSSYFTTSYTLFYSRRIANPTLAAKITGKEKGFSLGLLAAKNDNNGDGRFHGVFRLKKDILRLSWIGLIYSSIEDGDNWNRNLGLDFSLKYKKVYSLVGMVAYSFNKNDSKSKNGMYFLSLTRRVDKGFYYQFNFYRVEPNVYVPAGYISYVNYQRFGMFFWYTFRWEGKWLETLTFRFWKPYEKSISPSITKEKVTSYYMKGSTRNRINFSLSHAIGKYRPMIIDSNSEIVLGKSDYNSKSYDAYIDYFGNRIVQFSFYWMYFHDFVYNADFSETRPGITSEVDLGTNFKFSPQVQWRIDYRRTRYHSLDNAIRFKGDILSSTLNYQVSKNISSFIKFQYDSSLERYQYDFLILYEMTNLSKVYLSIKNYSENRFRFFNPDTRSIAFKLSYLLRI